MEFLLRVPRGGCRSGWGGRSPGRSNLSAARNPGDLPYSKLDDLTGLLPWALSSTPEVARGRPFPKEGRPRAAQNLDGQL